MGNLLRAPARARHARSGSSVPPSSLIEGRVFQGVGGEGRGDLSEITREAQVQSPGVIIGPANAQIATETSRDLPLYRKWLFFLPPNILPPPYQFGILSGQLICLPALLALSIFARETRAAVRLLGINSAVCKVRNGYAGRCRHMYPLLRFGEGIRLVALSRSDDRTPQA